MQYDYTNFYFGAGDDAFAMLEPFDEWWKDSEPAGFYLYGLSMQGAPTSRVAVRNTKTNEVHSDLLNFASYNYLGLSYRPEVKEAVIEAVRAVLNRASRKRWSLSFGSARRLGTQSQSPDWTSSPRTGEPIVSGRMSSTEATPSRTRRI